MLSYYLNDIDVTAWNRGVRFPKPYVRDAASRYLVERSHVLNLAYWSWFNLTHADLTQGYWLFVRDCYGNEEIWREHSNDILQFVEFAKKGNTRLIALVFPELANLEASRPYTAKVAELLRQSGAEAIDLAERLRGRKTADLIVHPGDRHPSAALHREVAELLFERIRSADGQKL